MRVTDKLESIHPYSKARAALQRNIRPGNNIFIINSYLHNIHYTFYTTWNLSQLPARQKRPRGTPRTCHRPATDPPMTPPGEGSLSSGSARISEIEETSLDTHRLQHVYIVGKSRAYVLALGRCPGPIGCLLYILVSLHFHQRASGNTADLGRHVR